MLVLADSSGRPSFLAFPNIDSCPSSSSFVEVADEVSVCSSTDARTSYDLCRILSSQGPHHSRSWERCGNRPSPGYRTVSDTNDRPRDATTSHSRKTSPRQYLEQHTHRWYPASPSLPELAQRLLVVAEKFPHLHLPLPLPGQT